MKNKKSPFAKGGLGDLGSCKMKGNIITESEIEQAALDWFGVKEE